jgi:NAD-dependent deacetylase sirtuin 5
MAHAQCSRTRDATRLQEQSTARLAILPLPPRDVRPRHCFPDCIRAASSRTTPRRALRAKPNAAHAALAQLSLPSIRNALAPGSTFTLITQNVDGLSRIALDAATRDADVPEQPMPTAAPEPPRMDEQPSLLEMHGRLYEVACTSRKCGHKELDYSSPLAPAFAGTEDLKIEKEIALDDLPRCKKCRSLARPGVVWFGETPWYLDEIDKLVEKADLCLVVGTSSTVRVSQLRIHVGLMLSMAQVYPAAGYASEVQEHGGKVAVFNLERSSGDEDADFLFLGPCEETLPAALGVGKK